MVTPPKNTDNLLEKAAQQILGEKLGFDEGRAYYLILIKKDKEIEKEFSYSKKYRLLKNLFDSGAIGKLKSNDREFFGYIPMPPSFLKKASAPETVIAFLEDLYAKNHKEILEKTAFSQLILKDLNGFVLFLLKHIMREKASILGTEITQDHLNSHLKNSSGKQDKINNIILKQTTLKKRHLGVIDDCLCFEFLKIRNKESHDYIGYIAGNKDKATNEYLEGIKKEFSKQ